MKLNSEKIIRHSSIKLKQILNYFRSNKEPESIIYILGYGRSGTSILINLLAHFFTVDAHGEGSRIMNDNYQLNIKKFEDLIAHNCFNVIALKPILNSCDASIFLKSRNTSKVVWMFRDYNDVTYSAFKKFGKRVSIELKEYIIYEKQTNWIYNQIQREEIQIIKKLDVHRLSDTDWMALVWWFVNHTIIRQKLYDNNNFVAIEYNDFVNKPDKYLEMISSFCLLRKNNLYKYIDRSRIGKGKNVNLSSDVEIMCSNLFKNLQKYKVKL